MSSPRVIRTAATRLHVGGAARDVLPRLALARSPPRVVLALVAAGVLSGCVVRPWQRERLAAPEMQFQMSAYGDAQEGSVLEITEGGTFGSAGPGGAGAGCGCH